MDTSVLFVICQVALMACALVSGVFLTFSDFVMRSLGKSQTAAGVEAMQVINREVFRTVFMVLLLGFSAAAPLLVGYAWVSLSGPLALAILAGGSLYFVGVFGVSMLFNVPMNGRLDKLAYDGATAGPYWRQIYLPRWTFWNWVRAISAALAALCFLRATLLLQSSALAVG